MNKTKLLLATLIPGVALVFAGTGVGIGYAIWHNSDDLSRHAQELVKKINVPSFLSDEVPYVPSSADIDIFFTSLNANINYDILEKRPGLLESWNNEEDFTVKAGDWIIVNSQFKFARNNDRCISGGFDFSDVTNEITKLRLYNESPTALTPDFDYYGLKLWVEVSMVTFNDSGSLLHLRGEKKFSNFLERIPKNGDYSFHTKSQT
ncbi:MAG: hypothetical protein LBJ97_03875 [Mycoplasmataceae bacterium]|nr:hypothetical protein [Mycoplasmataceae bacterium]